jgi:hypothetical protein
VRAGAPAQQRFRELKKTQKASNRWAWKSSWVIRERSKQDPGLGDEPSCPNQFHAKESRANQPGFVVFGVTRLSVGIISNLEVFQPT